MKNLHIALCLSAFLLVFALFVFLPKSAAQNNVLYDLLSLPAPPPPNPNFIVFAGNSNTRPAEFYSRKNPPSDDAPIDEIMDYWRRQNAYDPTSNFTIKPSGRTLDRILSELEKNPERLGSFLNVLSTGPNAGEKVKRIYEMMKANSNPEDYEGNNVEAWLAHNTNYKIDQLAETASKARDENNYVTNQAEVLALARVDWERARPLLERMVSDSTQPVSQTLARWALLEHAVRDGNSIEADRYRDDLKKTVEDKSAKPGNRDLAMDAIVRTGDFAGRDDWYFSLLDDETLHDLRVNGQTYTGLTTILNLSDPEKYVDKMIEYVRTGSPNQRAAAIRNLATVLDEKNPEVIRVLLPWLENPAWAKDINGSRRLVVAALSEIEMPESVPGLIAVLDEKAEIRKETDNDPPPPPPDYVNSNVMIEDKKMDFVIDSYDSEGVYPYRSAAIDALAKQKSIQAVPALRRILPEVIEWRRMSVIKAILDSGGFTVAEQIDALETVAEGVKTQMEATERMKVAAMAVAAKARLSAMTNAVESDNDEEILDMSETPLATAPRAMGMAANRSYSMSNTDARKPFSYDDIKPILGIQVASINEPSTELVSGVVNRIAALENRNPGVANALRKIIQNWNGTAINALMLNDLGKDKLDADAIVKLLSLRKTLRENQSNDVFAARNGANPLALGITSCILENDGEYAQILASDNASMKIALLGCARLIRAKLPVQTVAENLKSSNPIMVKAAKLYLESEDSPEARGIIYAMNPNKAKILGATIFFPPDENMTLGNFQFLGALFSSVSKTNNFESYMLYSAMSTAGTLEASEKYLQKEIIETPEVLGIYAYNQNFVRIYADKTVFSWAENDARYRERVLDSREFDYLKNYLSHNNVNTLPPFIGNCGSCQSRELLMLGASGGRRIYVQSEEMPEFFAGLDKIFEDMRRPQAKLKYYLEKEIAGLEILYADDNLKANTVWKNGSDLRILTEDEQRRKQIDSELEKANQQVYANAEDENFDYEKYENESMKRRQMRQFEEFAWRSLTGERLGDYVGQPPGFDSIPRQDTLPAQPDTEQWKRRAGNVEIRSSDGNIYRVKDGRAVKILEGNYNNPVISSDGRWAIALKYDYESEEQSLIRINVQTGKETKIPVKEEIGIINPVVFVPSNGKFLVTVGGYYDYGSERAVNGSFYFLDGETGALQPIKGEVRPLVQQTFRPLQTNGKPDEFWAAIPDRKDTTQIGVYNARTLTFTPTIKIPRIAFDSMDLWVDEPGNKIYFVHQGQVLALPLRKTE